MIEVEVHQQLHAFLREQGEATWPHHLTIARLVARALRLQRSALIQVSASASYQGRYRLSYLASIMLWPGSVMVVVPEPIRQQLLQCEIPRLSEWMRVEKPLCLGFPDPSFGGAIFVSPQEWLADHLSPQPQLPATIPLILDGADALEEWVCDHVTAVLQPHHWDALLWTCPSLAAQIRNLRVALTHALFQHPDNPYRCSLIEAPEQEILIRLHHLLQEHRGFRHCPPWPSFWQQFLDPESLKWAEVNREKGTFSLHAAPVSCSEVFQGLWSQRAVVLLGSHLDSEPDATTFRQRVGLEALTCVQFGAEQQTEAIQLYLPDGLPMPNTPQFQAALVQHLQRLLLASVSSAHPTILIVDDLPLKGQIATVLASYFGSRVRVETLELRGGNILVTGWEFWQQAQQYIPPPQLLVIATLPIPSPEDPRVAGRMAYYKRRRQDWFRLFLLPEALRTLQRAIAPLRERQGVVALLDNRVLHRSYGQQVLSALSPYGRLDYVDETLFQGENLTLVDRA
ncbi:ATP-dependent DNA helicase [Synechococcales cyanobacterium C]|uniref:ATP-dependent DNA helicase n=1 Tax=Petrachloros mirabilis ULC683 TaxID=2781853 RepID=A0A8K2ANE8_9CYAN|nr:ATP-dependent DNA helicase [Petrachloros mirabilis ULC683]